MLKPETCFTTTDVRERGRKQHLPADRSARSAGRAFFKKADSIGLLFQAFGLKYDKTMKKLRFD
ncbi:hypothetical protein C6I21_06530 [Alkalicoccus urumqiensis]|uniref:Uncharacterized protein n=1 Tax=Alkalicoccus urumqiensis TaxID=1548213 RepID=A0A2P6MI42_ALKUR|nr:hypothetical protein C6I21_06530 [Alkalicoccus urumqiensis]